MKMTTLKATLAVLGATALPAAVMAQAIPAKTYVMKAGASDLFERQSAKLMMMSKNDKIRDFASMMVKDHTESTEDVKAAAMQAGMHPAPPKLMPKQVHDLAALKAKHGMARDMLYVEQQKMAHQDALMLQQGYSTDGTVEPLKAAATKIVPVVQQHITMLDGMAM